MSILSWDKPKKLRPTKEHNKMYQSDSEVAGTYVPNMKLSDMLKWKAKLISGEDPRVEIRKTVVGNDRALELRRKKENPLHHKLYRGEHSCQIVMIVRPDASVRISANGPMMFDGVTWKEMQEAIEESIEALLKDGNHVTWPL